jgi:hypothetical protein
MAWLALSPRVTRPRWFIPPALVAPTVAPPDPDPHAAYGNLREQQGRQGRFQFGREPDDSPTEPRDWGNLDEAAGLSHT